MIQAALDKAALPYLVDGSSADAVCAPATLGHAMNLAAAIAAKSPVAMAGRKLAINDAVDHPTADALQQMTLLQSAIFDIDEMALAIEAWKAKRNAEFAALAPVSPV